ncbi:MAG: hypothetical protein M1600_07770 [Firmicutes bacterium]|nr:hypothetical protein [Bacillota bacterium]
MHRFERQRGSLKWVTIGLAVVSLLGVDEGFTSTMRTPTPPAHNSQTLRLTSPQVINMALETYFQQHHIWHGLLPLLPETLGISTVISQKYPHSFIVNLVAGNGSVPSSLNSPKANPNRLPLADLWGDYARTPIGLAHPGRGGYLAFAAPGGLTPAEIPAVLSSWHTLIPTWRTVSWVTVQIANGIRGYYTANSGYAAAVVWHQDHWWIVMQGMVGRSKSIAVRDVRKLTESVGVGLPGQGTLYAQAAGDGEHTVAAWQCGSWDYVVGSYHSADQALTLIQRWMKVL